MEIRPVTNSRRDLGAFCRLQARLSGAEPHCVLPLRLEVEKVLSETNPFWRHAERATVGGPPGWTGGGPDRRGILDAGPRPAISGERCAFFGFFEAVDDPAVAARPACDTADRLGHGIGERSGSVVR
jgi:hypothetical protein